ncbi:MAG TPA: MFS transporter [Candidatus Angelobacter sp.]
MASPAPALTFREVMRQKPFRRLWLAQFVSIFGDFLALFGVISLITFRLHGSAVDVTLVSLAYVLPLALVSPPAGVLVDHWNVKRVMIASDLIRALLVLLLVFVTSVPQICVIFAVLSMVSSFFVPAQSVTLRALVPQEGLLAANALMSQAFYTVRLLSPTLAAALVAWLSEKSCFYLDSLSFFFSAVMLSTLSVVGRSHDREKTLRALTNDFVAGNKFIFTHRGLAFVFTAMAMAMFVLSSFSPLSSIYIRDTLSAGVFWYGIMSTMVGVGMILGTQILTKVARNISKQVMVLCGLLGLGAGAALLGLSRNIPMATVSTLTIGFTVAFVLVPAQTLSQQETPHELMGRVSSSFMSLIALAQVMGLLLSGYLAQILGIRRLFLVCGLFLALLAAGGYMLLREQKRAVATLRA